MSACDYDLVVFDHPTLSEAYRVAVVDATNMERFRAVAGEA
ncbi:hypothetical protein [Actinokineospora sp. PR83]|nr:hypothetical protein [Actinokineospora sp. PR83]